MAKRRIFIAIEIPDEIREKIIETVKRWQWLPIRWIKPENWHVTVIPPFYADDKELAAVRSSFEALAGGLRPFSISFRSIILAPPGKRARMIWLAGPFSRGLQKLKDDVLREFSEKKLVGAFRAEERALSPHVTLARFDEGDLIELEEKTRILEKVKLSFRVESADIMESHLKSSGAEYERLNTVPLGTPEVKPAYEFLPHTADLRIRSRGETLEELFEASLLGMAEYMKKDALSLKAFSSRPVEVSSSDASLLLIDFLSEALTMSDTYNEVYPRAAFDEFSETHLKGTLFGSTVDEFDEDIKAVTYHGAEVKKTAQGFEATIIYDI